MHLCVLLPCMLVSVPVHADDHCGPSEHDSYEFRQRVVNLNELLPVSRLLATLESYDQCDTLARINRGLDLRYEDNIRVHAAIYMVTIVGRNPATVSTRQIREAYALANSMRFRTHRQDLIDYAARKLSSVPDNEPLFSFVDGAIPPTVEKQIFVAATIKVPKGPWQPPGDQPIPFYIGNDAHRVIAQHYEQAHLSDEVRLNNTPIASLLSEFADMGVGPAANKHTKAISDRALRPDITNLTTREIYEIKPAGLESVAAAVVSRNIDVFSSSGVTMKPGRSHAAGTSGVLPAPAGHYRFYSPRPGVIVYQYKPGDYVPIEAGEPRADEREQRAFERLERRHAVPVRANASRRSRKPSEDGFLDRISRATGLSGKALLVYVIISEGSRLFPPRNLIPAP